ncbi:hypothetical protein NX059_012416 [Plenodomus lindquistii]|nr:hypothetical protein NX059_012416 [Plenodomus lindquistii]
MSGTYPGLPADMRRLLAEDAAAPAQNQHQEMSPDRRSSDLPNLSSSVSLPRPPTPRPSRYVALSALDLLNRSQSPLSEAQLAIVEARTVRPRTPPLGSKLQAGRKTPVMHPTHIPRAKKPLSVGVHHDGSPTRLASSARRPPRVPRRGQQSQLSPLGSPFAPSRQVKSHGPGLFGAPGTQQTFAPVLSPFGNVGNEPSPFNLTTFAGPAAPGEAPLPAVGNPGPSIALTSTAPSLPTSWNPFHEQPFPSHGSAIPTIPFWQPLSYSPSSPHLGGQTFGLKQSTLDTSYLALGHHWPEQHYSGLDASAGVSRPRPMGDNHAEKTFIDEMVEWRRRGGRVPDRVREGILSMGYTMIHTEEGGRRTHKASPSVSPKSGVKRLRLH